MLVDAFKVGYDVYRDHTARVNGEESPIPDMDEQLRLRGRNCARSATFTGAGAFVGSVFGPPGAFIGSFAGGVVADAFFNETPA